MGSNLNSMGNRVCDPEGLEWHLRFSETFPGIVRKDRVGDIGTNLGGAICQQGLEKAWNTWKRAWGYCKMEQRRVRGLTFPHSIRVPPVCTRSSTITTWWPLTSPLERTNITNTIACLLWSHQMLGHHLIIIVDPNTSLKSTVFDLDNPFLSISDLSAHNVITVFWEHGVESLVCSIIWEGNSHGVWGWQAGKLPLQEGDGCLQPGMINMGFAQTWITRRYVHAIPTWVWYSLKSRSVPEEREYQIALSERVHVRWEECWTAVWPMSVEMQAYNERFVYVMSLLARVYPDLGSGNLTFSVHSFHGSSWKVRQYESEGLGEISAKVHNHLWWNEFSQDLYPERSRDAENGYVHHLGMA